MCCPWKTISGRFCGLHTTFQMETLLSLITGHLYWDIIRCWTSLMETSLGWFNCWTPLGHHHPAHLRWESLMEIYWVETPLLAVHWAEVRLLWRQLGIIRCWTDGDLLVVHWGELILPMEGHHCGIRCWTLNLCWDGDSTLGCPMMWSSSPLLLLGSPISLQVQPACSLNLWWRLLGCPLSRSTTAVDEAIYQMEESSLEMRCIQLWWLSYCGDYQFKICLESSRVVSSCLEWCHSTLPLLKTGDFSSKTGNLIFYYVNFQRLKNWLSGCKPVGHL